MRVAGKAVALDDGCIFRRRPGLKSSTIASPLGVRYPPEFPQFRHRTMLVRKERGYR